MTSCYDVKYFLGKYFFVRVSTLRGAGPGRYGKVRAKKVWDVRTKNNPNEITQFSGAESK